MQVVGVRMGWSLWPVLSDICKFELEKAVLPELIYCIKYSKRYVDYTLSFVKPKTINYIITKINSFDNKINFTFEEKGKGILPFLSK